MKNYSKEISEKIKQMTIEEKVSQLTNSAAGIERLNIKKYNWWNEALHGVARAGKATVFPQAIGLAATWDEDLLAEIATAISIEGRAKYNKAKEKDEIAQYHGLTYWSRISIFSVILAGEEVRKPTVKTRIDGNLLCIYRKFAE